MAGKNFKVLQMMERKVKERYSRLERFDRQDKPPYALRDEQWERIKDLLPGGT
ncbi:hypothetical protein QUA40_15650 [Microcoleus sp. Pol11C3]|uniref:hypothetical protein n=1 Tax=Microcoleus sp. Pol11C3 TaxID=3055390 RepID=UPI002FCE76D4